jgi:hypothetical protein
MTRRFWSTALALSVVLLVPSPARAGRLGWLDEMVRQVIRDARAEGRAASRSTGRLFVRESEESLAALSKRSDEMARLARRVEEPSEALLEARFDRVVGSEAGLVRGFQELAPAEKRLVVELGETAQTLARRHPDQAEDMIRALGVEGLTAVRVYGDDVAEVVLKEGPESLNVLRKTGRKGWDVYTKTILAHKRKLAAAGVLGLFLANPEKFVDTAGNLTQYAVEQFARAGIDLAGGIGSGAARGLENSIAGVLEAHGLNSLVLRKVGMVLAALVALAAVLVLLGLPLGWMLRPFTWPMRLVLGRIGGRSV